MSFLKLMRMGLRTSAHPIELLGYNEHNNFCKVQK
jgi:hypothetical protein